jgi:hypothetical protein
MAPRAAPPQRLPWPPCPVCHQLHSERAVTGRIFQALPNFCPHRQTDRRTDTMFAFIYKIDVPIVVRPLMWFFCLFGGGPPPLSFVWYASCERRGFGNLMFPLWFALLGYSIVVLDGSPWLPLFFWPGPIALPKNAIPIEWGLIVTI